MNEGVFVTKEECAAHREDIAKDIAETNKNMAKIEVKLNMLIGICGAIGAAAVGIFFKLIIGG